MEAKARAVNQLKFKPFFEKKKVAKVRVSEWGVGKMRGALMRYPNSNVARIPMLADGSLPSLPPLCVLHCATFLHKCC